MHSAEFESFFANLSDSFSNSSDFTIKNYVIRNTEVRLCFLSSLVDFRKTNEYLTRIGSLMAEADSVMEKLALHGGGQENVPYRDAVSALSKGKLLVVSDPENYVLLDPPQVPVERNIQTSLSENMIQASFDAFTENIDTNIGILRSKIASSNLVIDTFGVGSVNPRQMAVVYYRGIIKNEIVDNVLGRLKNNHRREIRNVQDLCRILGHKWWNVIPTSVSTEIPAETVEYLTEGRILLFMDNFPFALVIPAIVSDIWCIKSDANFPVIFMASIRIVRMIGLLVSTVAPGLYVALVAVNPEALRIQLALAVARSREGVPYPAVIEIILMLLILEMIVEASVRLPKSIGPTITMVGGIILGEAVVQAKLVSNLLIITLAATTIANFTVSGITHMLMIRLMKYVVLVLSAIFGILGLIGSLQLIGCYMAAITTMSIPYLSIKLKEAERYE
ncbi:spore germination protein [Paenibacillus agaridevorans]|uniref:spore germination protein n=1 Tax=Paenibacillus agaridevorans TaxID=171404 RepID=UPI001BE4984B|nr:spore germination protein [Paenibacillus agaridevorans]